MFPESKDRPIALLVRVMALVVAAVFALSACSSDEPASRDDPKAPVKVTVESENGSSVSVYLVDKSMADEPFGVLRDCARTYLKDFDTVSCFGFESEEALVAAQVDEEKGGMKYLCWSAFYNVRSDGSRQRSRDNAQYDTEHCPA